MTSFEQSSNSSYQDDSLISNKCTSCPFVHIIKGDIKEISQEISDTTQFSTNLMQGMSPEVKSILESAIEDIGMRPEELVPKIESDMLQLTGRDLNLLDARIDQAKEFLGELVLDCPRGPLKVRTVSENTEYTITICRSALAPAGEVTSSIVKRSNK